MPYNWCLGTQKRERFIAAVALAVAVAATAIAAAGAMNRREYLAALSLLSTRRRLDLRGTAFKAFVAEALQKQELLQPQHIHLTIHRYDMALF